MPKLYSLKSRPPASLYQKATERQTRKPKIVVSLPFQTLIFFNLNLDGDNNNIESLTKKEKKSFGMYKPLSIIKNEQFENGTPREFASRLVDSIPAFDTECKQS
ncbi:hypothetical protein NPIL_320811 [Nephila pilipes]|uniref:Uncharacterized protein n=1 Tax=Nephila pilipes TaxID=299642 RepID=A0A8X6TJE8_NEPPI|nr:hypothetical protein NPIL_320811 [Nephila pilipes]